MADFTVLKLEGNHGTQATPVWVEVGPTTGKEVRWSDSPTQNGIASGSWPAMIRPASTQIVSYTYAYTADATGFGFISGQASPCPAFANSNFQWARWNWDASGTFASAPIYTAYKTAASHDSPGAGDGTLLGGHATDTGSRSYLKANVYGQVGAPGAAPGAAPAVGNGAVGNQQGTTGATWMTNYGDLQGDIDWITAGFTPGAGANVWHVMFALFTGPNEIPGTYIVVMTLKYTWT